MTMPETSPNPAVAVHPERLRRAQAELARHGIDWLLCGPGADLQYLTGLRGHYSERMSVLLLPRAGEAAWVVPVLEAPLLDGIAGFVRAERWDETEDPAARVARVTAGASEIAVNETLWSAFLIRLQAAMPDVLWREATPVLRALRMVKDAREIALMREAAHRTDAAWEEFIRTPIAGLTEKAALQRLLDLTYAKGLGANFGMCASGPFSASPHYSGGDRVIQPGEAVIFDWGGTLEGYNSDVTRTVWVGPGEPDPEFARAYAVVLDANEATFRAVRPGVPCEELDATARRVIEAGGFGEFIMHRVGHGLGLSIHEEPYLVSGNALPLAAGMTFSDEPGVYLPGRFGVRVEDTVLCTADGAERLNEATRELTVMA